MRRRKFSETEVLATAQIALFQRNIYLLCYRCGNPLFGPIMNEDRRIVGAIAIGQIEREHYLELALGGEDGPRNCVYSHKDCHKKATNGTKATTAGSSKHRIAKVRRIQAGGKKRKGKPIPSRPFPKVKIPMRRKPK